MWKQRIQWGLARGMDICALCTGARNPAVVYRGSCDTGSMVARPRHQRPEGKHCSSTLRPQGWTGTPRNRYFRLLCPCGRYALSIPLTPSGSRTLLNKTKHIERQPCWRRPS